jgi:TRAP-type C4-dicarboxylate transport system substrate-binding protein
VNGQVASEVVTRLGGTPISLPASNMYEGLQRGTIDGVDTGWGAFEPYRLYEVTSYHVDDPIGTAPCMFFMLRTKFDALPEVARKALMDNGREPETRAFAQHNGSMGQRMKQKTESLPNQKIVKLPPQQLADWKTRTEPVVANWEKAHPQGEKLVAMYRKLYAEVKAGQ